MILVFFIPEILLLLIRWNCISLSLKGINELTGKLQICEKMKTNAVCNPSKSLYEKEKKVKECLEEVESIEEAVYSMENTNDSVRAMTYLSIIMANVSVALLIKSMSITEGVNGWLIVFVVALMITFLISAYAVEGYKALISYFRNR